MLIKILYLFNYYLLLLFIFIIYFYYIYNKGAFPNGDGPGLVLNVNK